MNRRVVARKFTRVVFVVFCVLAATSHTQPSWSLRQPSNTTRNLYGVSWNGSLLVAVGEGGVILSSNDAVTWTSRPSGTTRILRDIIHAEGTFVAVGVAGTILTSQDGMAWTERNANLPLWGGAQYDLESVCWADGLFIAVGYHGGLATSEDGIAWTARATGIDYALRTAIRAGGQWVALGSMPALSAPLATSPDAIQWTIQTTNSPASLWDALWRQDRLIGVGINRVVATSMDFGHTWAVKGSGTGPTRWYAMAQSPERVVSVGDIGNGSTGPRSGVQTSADGLNWAIHPITAYSTLNDVIWTGEKFVAVGDVGAVLSSPDGVSWTSQTSVDAADLTAVEWAGGRFVASGRYGTLWTSQNSATWSMQRLDSIPQSFVFSRNDTRLLAIGSSVVWTSDEGEPWVRHALDSTLPVRSVSWTGNRFVGVGTGRAYISSDGVSWTRIDPGTSASLLAVQWIGNRLVVVGSASPSYGTAQERVTLTSPDGISWTNHGTGGGGAVLSALAWSGSLLVGVGVGGAVATSHDGMDWISRVSGTGASLAAVVWTGKRFVASGAGGVIISSENGVDWAAESSGTSETLYALAMSDSNIVAVGARSTIVASKRMDEQSTALRGGQEAFAMRNQGTLLNVDVSVLFRGTGARASLLTAAGRRVMEAAIPPDGQLSIGTETLPRGVYVLEIRNGAQRAAQRFTLTR